MKTMKFLLLIIFAVLILTGCEDGAAIRITNQTNHNLYGSIDGIDFTIAGKEVYEVDVDTDRKVPFFADGRTKKMLTLRGETFRIFDEYNKIYYDQTEIIFTPGHTYKVYCSPNSASVKIINHSNQRITKLKYRKVTQFTNGELFLVTFDPPIEPGDFAYHNIAFQTNENRFYYTFVVETENGNSYDFGGNVEESYLSIDEQYLIEFCEN